MPAFPEPIEARELHHRYLANIEYTNSARTYALLIRQADNGDALAQAVLATQTEALTVGSQRAIDAFNEACDAYRAAQS